MSARCAFAAEILGKAQLSILEILLRLGVNWDMVPHVVIATSPSLIGLFLQNSSHVLGRYSTLIFKISSAEISLNLCS